MLMVQSNEIGESPATHDKTLLHHLKIRMPLNWECAQLVYAPSPAEFLDGELLRDCSEHLAIKIEILALQLKIFHALTRPFLFTQIVPETSGLTTPTAGRNHMFVGFEEGPEQVIGDLAVFKEGYETLCGGSIVFLDGTDQQVKSCETSHTGSRVNCLISSKRFELGKVVE